MSSFFPVHHMASPFEEMLPLASLPVVLGCEVGTWMCTTRKYNFLTKHLTVLQFCTLTHAFLFEKCPSSQLLLNLWHPGKTYLNFTKSELEAPLCIPQDSGLTCLLTLSTALGAGVLGCSLVDLTASSGPCSNGGGQFSWPFPGVCWFLYCGDVSHQYGYLVFTTAHILPVIMLLNGRVRSVTPSSLS